MDEIKLNHSSKCGKLFKYKENNKRDLVMFSYKSIKNDYYSKRSLLIYNIIPLKRIFQMQKKFVLSQITQKMTLLLKY